MTVDLRVGACPGPTVRMSLRLSRNGSTSRSFVAGRNGSSVQSTEAFESEDSRAISAACGYWSITEIAPVRDRAVLDRSSQPH